MACVFMLGTAACASAAEIPAGTQIQIRLTTEVNSATAKAGQTFGALVIVPVIVNDRVAMAAGVPLAGHVKEATPAVQPGDQAVLTLAFDEIRDSRGAKAAVSASSRASTTRAKHWTTKGAIQGIVASKTGSGRLDQGIGKVAEKYPDFADILGTVKQAVLKAPDANIDYKPGVEMTIELSKPMEWTEPRTSRT